MRHKVQVGQTNQLFRVRPTDGMSIRPRFDLLTLWCVTSSFNYTYLLIHTGKQSVYISTGLYESLESRATVHTRYTKMAF